MRVRVLFILIILLGLLLRIYDVGVNPPSLYWDEASLGYNAYTIATSLRDEHGEFLPLARFSAFGDYKPPGYIYAIVPFLALFGVNEFSVRLPSILAGTGMVILTYFLVRELLRFRKIALLASFFLAVSPWSIQLSRAAFEANLAAFFNLAGIYFFLLGMKKVKVFPLSILFFVFSFYTFNANRIIAPILFFILFLLKFHTIRHHMRVILISCLFGFLLLIPSVSYLQSYESKLRFQEVTILTNPAPTILSNQRITVDGGSIFSKFIHNRRLLYFEEFLKHYTDNFQGRFLFTRGDANLRLSSQDMGELYPWDLLLFIMGIYGLITRFRTVSFFFILWILIVPIPAALARETPHALRIVSLLPVYQIIAAVGLALILAKRKPVTKKIVSALCVVLFIVQLFYFLHGYFIHYPSIYSGAWQYGYKEMVEYVTRREGQYDNIFITDALGRPYIYFAFYNKIPVDEFLQGRIAQRDQFGLWNVSSLGKIHVTLNGLDKTNGKTLVVTKSNYLPADYRKLTTISDPWGNSVFDIGEKE